MICWSLSNYLDGCFIGYRINTPSGISSFLCVVNQSGKMASGAFDSFLVNSTTFIPEFWRVLLKLSNSNYAYIYMKKIRFFVL